MLTIGQRLAGLPPALAQQTLRVARLLEQGQVDAAERGASAIMAQAPNHPEILRLAGEVLQRRGSNQRALGVLERARAARDDDAAIHNALAGVYEALNDTDRARTALRRACELAPDWGPCWFNYAWRLYVDGEIDAAICAARRALTLAPHDAQARSLLADVLLADGKTEQAAIEYRRIIAAQPSAGVAWWGLATLKPVPFGERDIQTMRRVLRDATLGEADRVTIGSALGIALEAHGDFAGAFDAMRGAHAVARRHEPYDAIAFSGRVDSILDAFATGTTCSREAQGREVVFIVSMPRSGSTLTEQILASHSQVAAGAEISILPQVLMRESERLGRPFPEWVRTHTPEQWCDLGRRYLERTQRWRAQHPRFTDKLPGNWLYVGAIAAMLPNARVVVCRRDPVETCLGCYRYMFRRHPYTHDFADLARRWRDFDRAVRHWKTRYPGRVHELVYEDLIADPNAQVHALLEFCGLPFENACLKFHASARRVSTPSAAQVREPMRRDTARAHKYRALLDPLRKELGLPPFAAG